MYVTCNAILMTCTPLDHQPASRICCSCPHLHGLPLADGSSPEVALGIEMNRNKSLPDKGYCTCPIGKCGICCHAIAALMFLQHYYKLNTCLLSLTVKRR